MPYPCVHAAVTICFCRQGLCKYVSHANKTENLKQHSSLSIDPILVDELVPQSIFPPVVCHILGRPKRQQYYAPIV